MLGSYRLFLAVMVVVGHLAGVPKIGGYAVFGFYLISGYLMTLVIQRAYGYGVVGFAYYALNRFLRIYPAYWVSILLSLFLIYMFGAEFFARYRREIALPDGGLEWARNVLIYFPGLEAPRLTPPSWALTVELAFYIAIGLGLSAGKKTTAVWFFCSVGYHVGALLLGRGYEERYFPVWAASLPFSTGAAMYHFKSHIKRAVTGIPFFSNPLMIPVLGVMFFANWYVGQELGVSGSVSFYINFLICCLALVGFAFVWPRSFGNDIDGVLGSLSYPVYLLHYQVGAMVLFIFSALGVEMRRGEVGFLLAALPFVMLVAYLMVVLIERPIEGVRVRVKSNVIR